MSDTQWVTDRSGNLYEIPEDILSKHQASEDQIKALAAQAKDGAPQDADVQGYYMAGYQIQYGDSLWSIAQRVYGDGSMWPLLYYMNRDSVRNPNMIYAGNYLRIAY